MNIYPFKGILYNTDKVNIEDVVTLPYDKISPQQKAIYKKRSPYNMVHLILPLSHESAASSYRKWMKEGVLREDPEPAIYVYEQVYEYPKGVSRVRRGFIALLEVEPFSKNTIMPHEKTFPNIVEDRIGLLDSCKANIEQIFILYSDKDVDPVRSRTRTHSIRNNITSKTIASATSNGLDKLLSGSPRFNFKDEFGITHKLWSITNPGIIRTLEDDISNARLFIADGHHRYTASLAYKEKMGGDRYMMATFVDSNSRGLTILPTHRVLKKVLGLDNGALVEKLKEYFTVEGMKQPDFHIRVYLDRDNYYSLRLKEGIALEKILGIQRAREWLYLNVNILHLLILKHIMKAQEGENIVYLREESEAIDMVKNKGAKAAFILNPTSIEDVKQIVSLGEVMPHKSTDFYPKLHSGLVMRNFTEHGTL